MNFTLKQVRKIMGLKQDDVAKECNVAKKTVGRYELNQFFHKRVEAWHKEKEIEILKKLQKATAQDDFTYEQIRVIAGFSQEDVGNATNMHPRTVARFERGLSNHYYLQHWYKNTWENIKTKYADDTK